MIAFLQGILDIKKAHFVVINVGGVGYRVEISAQTYENLPSGGEEVRMLIHHHITDSDQRLFGFFSEREKQLFEKLITVKGVGPKLGLTIMSGLKAAVLIESIIQQDQAGLSRIPGIGKKTAQRIILELKEKMLESVDSRDHSADGSVSNKEEAISALEALGYKKKDAEKAVMQISSEEGSADVSTIVKKALMRQGK
ncbi:MAG: Holliday junction branch migration protein RuvA [Balneolaceae bacterium]